MDPVCVQKTIKAPLSKVYGAWTSAEIMQRWFFPGHMDCEATVDFRVGGAYRVVMRNENGAFPHHGTYREIIPEKKIVFTWSSHSVEDTLVSVEFEGDQMETRISLVHTLIPDEERAGDHRNGWNGCFQNLEKTMAA